MKKLYSQMTPQELEAEMNDIIEALEQAEFPSQKEQLQRKYYTAKAYTLNPADFPPGRYAVEGFDEPLLLQYVNGMMGWGVQGKDQEASFPLSMLTKLEA